MPMIQKLLLATAIGFPLVAAHAAPSADATPKDASAVMAALDTDHDGTVTLEEATAAATKKFDALDTDKEGTLDESELTGVLDVKKLGKFEHDRDGSLDKAEYVTLVTSMFKRSDVDHDGTLSPAELSSVAGRELVALLAY